jgi:hypothetical protein
VAALANDGVHSSWRHPERALFRRQRILHRMHDAGALGEAKLAAEPPPAEPRRSPGGPDAPE